MDSISGEKAACAARSLGCAFLDVEPVRARLWAVWGEQGLLALSWGSADSGPAEAVGDNHPECTSLPEPYAGLLRAYFAGEQVEPASLPIELAGTTFQVHRCDAGQR